jgi:hypothetical protein
MGSIGELEEWELWVLRVYFERYGLLAPHDKSDIWRYMRDLSFFKTEPTLQSLIDKKVLSLSPDNRKVRLTDYGLELFQAAVAAQGDWESRPVIKVSNLERDEVVIRAGETFKANRVLREIVAQAHSELCVLDPCISPILFDLSEEFAKVGVLRVITVDTVHRATVVAYTASRRQYPKGRDEGAWNGSYP